MLFATELCAVALRFLRWWFCCWPTTLVVSIHKYNWSTKLNAHNIQNLTFRKRKTLSVPHAVSGPCACVYRWSGPSHSLPYCVCACAYSFLCCGLAQIKYHQLLSHFIHMPFNLSTFKAAIARTYYVYIQRICLLKNKIQFYLELFVCLLPQLLLLLHLYYQIHSAANGFLFYFIMQY